MGDGKSFEQNLKSLERIVQKLESGEVSLDESIRLFEKGKALGQRCEKRLEEVELRIRELVEKEEGRLEAVEFEGPGDQAEA